MKHLGMAFAILMLTATMAHAQSVLEREDLEDILEEILEAVPAHDEPLHAKEEAREMVKEAMALVGQGQWVEALVSLKPYLDADAEEYSDLVDGRYYAELMSVWRYGPLMGTEHSQFSEMGDSLMMEDYIEKYEKHMIRWRFYLYKADQEWMITKIEFEHRREKIFSGS